MNDDLGADNEFSQGEAQSQPQGLAARLRNSYETMPENLRDRFKSSFVLMPVAILGVLVGGIWFDLMVLAAAILMSFEWKEITDEIQVGEDANRRTWMWRGVGYIAVVGASFLWLRGMTPAVHGYSGATILIWMLCVVWATDIAAFFTGRAIGGPKLAPSISPGKTWSGLAGGVAAAAIIGALFAMAEHMPGFVVLFLLSAMTSAVSQGGDLLESYIKRLCGVKDSGDLLPGHGGVLDRVDGLVTAAPFVVLALTLLGHP